MPMPKPDDESKVFFKSVMPEDPDIQVRPMFGNLASFIKGNMFAGLYGQQIFVRLPEDKRLQLLEEEGASEFSPMPGRPMKEYVAMPEKWREEPNNPCHGREKCLEGADQEKEAESGEKWEIK